MSENFQSIFQLDKKYEIIIEKTKCIAKIYKKTLLLFDNVSLADNRFFKKW